MIDRRDFLIVLLIYKCVNGLAPTYLSDLLVFMEEVHSLNTRQAGLNCLYVQQAKTQYYQKSLVVHGAKLWNNLTPVIWNATTTSAFKYLYKRYMH